MKLFSSKKRVAAIGAVTAITLAGGGVAYGYWTTSGSGTGTANVGTAVDDSISIAATVTGTLAPGGEPAVVSFKASNSENFSQKISKIHLDSITTTADGCLTVLGTDFSMGDVDVPEEGNLLPMQADKDLSATGALYMLDSGVNQDACQGAELTLNFTTS